MSWTKRVSWLIPYVSHNFWFVSASNFLKMFFIVSFCLYLTNVWYKNPDTCYLSLALTSYSFIDSLICDHRVKPSRVFRLTESFWQPAEFYVVWLSLTTLYTRALLYPPPTCWHFFISLIFLCRTPCHLAHHILIVSFFPIHLLLLKWSIFRIGALSFGFMGILPRLTIHLAHSRTINTY